MEERASANLPAHTLMQRAGLAVARLAMAVAPHANVIWVACGPGNNGGDGYEAARYLKQWGKSPLVTADLDHTGNLPVDAAASHQSALEAGVMMSVEAPMEYDLCIDALFGIGSIREINAPYTGWIKQINSGRAPVLAVDTPSGLSAETGTCHSPCVRADYTLSLLTLKPGLFTADGREVCGEIWLDPLNVAEPGEGCSKLNCTPPFAKRAHNTHKGSFGDVCIVGGAPGMAGAAYLAALAAIHGGAGRTYLAMLDESLPQFDSGLPEVMFRNATEIAYESMVIVAGCGGGNSIATHLPRILERACLLVLDADALNAISRDASLQNQLAARKPHSTVLTPHPLEAARLMNMRAVDVQTNRLAVAQAIADRFGCTVVLKGSGTIIAAPGILPRINATGNARLATAGTGDVLAGLIGARLASGGDVFCHTCESVYRHGKVADEWHGSSTMTAHDLASNL